MYDDSRGEEVDAELKDPGILGDDEMMVEELDALEFEKLRPEEPRECEGAAARDDLSNSAKSAYACTSLRRTGVIRCEKRSG